PAAETTIKRLRDELRMAELGALGEEQIAEVGTRTKDSSAASSEPAPGDPHNPSPIPFPLRPATDAEWHASLRRDPGRPGRRLARCLPADWNALMPTSALERANVFLRFRLPSDIDALFWGAVRSETTRLATQADAEEWGPVARERK